MLETRNSAVMATRTCARQLSASRSGAPILPTHSNYRQQDEGSPERKQGRLLLLLLIIAVLLERPRLAHRLGGTHDSTVAETINATTFAHDFGLFDLTLGVQVLVSRELEDKVGAVCKGGERSALRCAPKRLRDVQMTRRMMAIPRLMERMAAFSTSASCVDEKAAE